MNRAIAIELVRDSAIKEAVIDTINSQASNSNLLGKIQNYVEARILSKVAN